MKISGNQPNSISKDLTTGQTKSKELGKDDKASSLSQTRESVKTSAFTLDKIKSRVALEPEVRTDRVAELKAKIQNGTYKVDAQVLAEKMLKDSLQEDLATPAKG